MTYENPIIKIAEKEFKFTPDMFSYNPETGVLHIKNRTVTTLLDVQTPELRKERHAALVYGLGLKFRNVSSLTGVGVHNQGTVRIATYKNFEPIAKPQTQPPHKEEDKSTDKPEKPSKLINEPIVYGQNWDWSKGVGITPSKLKKERVRLPEGTEEELLPMKSRKYKLVFPKPHQQETPQINEQQWPDVIIFYFSILYYSWLILSSKKKVESKDLKKWNA
jgi:hypothetical protein